MEDRERCARPTGRPRRPRRLARSASLEILSAANKRRASVDLPDPAGPTMTTRLGSGTVRVAMLAMMPRRTRPGHPLVRMDR
jgi:hypothetical protein